MILPRKVTKLIPPSQHLPLYWAEKVPQQPQMGPLEAQCAASLEDEVQIQVLAYDFHRLDQFERHRHDEDAILVVVHGLHVAPPVGKMNLYLVIDGDYHGIDGDGATREHDAEQHFLDFFFDFFDLARKKH